MSASSAVLVLKACRATKATEFRALKVQTESDLKALRGFKACREEPRDSKGRKVQLVLDCKARRAIRGHPKLGLKARKEIKVTSELALREHRGSRAWRA